MSSARSALRPLVGGELGRGYYANSTLQAGSTTTELVDIKRVEFDGAWEGATVFIPSTGDEAVVAGNDPTGRLFLAQPLSGAPGTIAYEILKGWTFTNLNRALGQACSWAYPWAFAVINDAVTKTETSLVPVIALDAAWRKITKIRRQVGTTTTPILWVDLVEGVDYEIRQGAAGLEYESRGSPITGTKLWFMGEGLATIAAPEVSTAARVDDEIIIAGAAWWLYKLGPDPAEAAPGRWEKKAEAQWAMFQGACRKFGIPREAGKILSPRVTVTNDGSRSGISR